MRTMDNNRLIPGRRAVITGVGVVAPGEPGAKAFWERMTAGKPATGPITLFDASDYRCKVAAECWFDPAAAGLTPQQIRRTDRAGQLAIAATSEALADAGLAPGDLPPERTGVAIGNAIGNSALTEQEFGVGSDGGRLWLCDQNYAVPHAYCAMVPSSIAVEVAWMSQAEGPAMVISSGCTSGLDAVSYASQLIEEGSADVVISGATEAAVTPITVACFDALKATSVRNDDPQGACRPFDLHRDGLVLGEGAAVFVVEEAARARARGARIRAMIAGYDSRANAYHMTGLKADGRELAEAIRRALDSARIDPSEIDYVNAHGSATHQNDRHETAALKVSLGHHAYRIPASSIKSMVGHSLGGIGAIEIAACVFALEDQVVPPTANLETADPECDLDYVPGDARQLPVNTVLNVGSGFGGFQTAMVLTSARRSR
jgi:act minimal PKS ketosynthase (KS/KS alpha)